MNLGGFLIGLMISCNMRVVQDPATIEIEAVPVCHTSKKAFAKSIKSSVEIQMMSGEDYHGKASGNYFKYKGYTFVLTAAHVGIVPDGIEIYAKERFGVGKSIAKLVYADTETDLAILVLEEELGTVEPIPWQRKDHWDIDIGDDVYYTGHPMDMSYMSFSGTVSKVFSNMLILQGWAYMGTSGSAVFDKRGKVVGFKTGHLRITNSMHFLGMILYFKRMFLVVVSGV